MKSEKWGEHPEGSSLALSLCVAHWRINKEDSSVAFYSNG